MENIKKKFVDFLVINLQAIAILFFITNFPLDVVKIIYENY
jgi:hypothetical protein